jgi:adenylosuccinate synthase
LAVTKLDVLDTLDTLGICTGYQVGDEIYDEFPGEVTLLEQCDPVYEWFDGWKQSTANARKIGDLPAAARTYLDRIEELSETRVSYVSVGTRRDQIIPL